MVASLGKYYDQTKLGRVFIGSTAAAGVVPPIFSNTAQTFCIWNPKGSGKDIVLLKLQMGYVSGTAAASNFVLGYQSGVGSQPATASPITAATLVAPVNAYVGRGAPSIARFAPATITFTAGPSLLRTLGFSQLVTTAATTTGQQWPLETDFDGGILIPDDTAVCVAGNIATVSVMDIAMTWAEVNT